MPFILDLLLENELALKQHRREISELKTRLDLLGRRIASLRGEAQGTLSGTGKPVMQHSGGPCNNKQVVLGRVKVISKTPSSQRRSRAR